MRTDRTLTVYLMEGFPFPVKNGRPSSCEKWKTPWTDHPPGHTTTNRANQKRFDRIMVLSSSYIISNNWYPPVETLFSKKTLKLSIHEIYFTSDTFV